MLCKQRKETVSVLKSRQSKDEGWGQRVRKGDITNKQNINCTGTLPIQHTSKNINSIDVLPICKRKSHPALLNLLPAVLKVSRNWIPTCAFIWKLVPVCFFTSDKQRKRRVCSASLEQNNNTIEYHSATQIAAVLWPLCLNGYPWWDPRRFCQMASELCGSFYCRYSREEKLKNASYN